MGRVYVQTITKDLHRTVKKPRVNTGVRCWSRLLAREGLYRQLYDAQTRRRRVGAKDIEGRLRAALEKPK